MEMFYCVDTVMNKGDTVRLPLTDIVDLNLQMNCNLMDSEDNEGWFNEEIMPEHIQIITEDELFASDDLI